MLEPLAPRALVGKTVPMPDPEVRERPLRLRFTAEYKRRSDHRPVVRLASPGPPGGIRTPAVFDVVRTCLPWDDERSRRPSGRAALPARDAAAVKRRSGPPANAAGCRAREPAQGTSRSVRSLAARRTR